MIKCPEIFGVFWEGGLFVYFWLFFLLVTLQPKIAVLSVSSQVNHHTFGATRFHSIKIASVYEIIQFSSLSVQFCGTRAKHPM